MNRIRNTTFSHLYVHFTGICNFCIAANLPYQQHFPSIFPTSVGNLAFHRTLHCHLPILCCLLFSINAHLSHFVPNNWRLLRIYLHRNAVAYVEYIYSILFLHRNHSLIISCLLWQRTNKDGRMQQGFHLIGRQVDSLFSIRIQTQPTDWSDWMQISLTTPPDNNKITTHISWIRIRVEYAYSIPFLHRNH